MRAVVQWALGLLCVCHAGGAAWAQKPWFRAYHPNGTEIKAPFSKIKDVLDTLGLKEAHAFRIDKADAVVYFQKLTRTPKAVIFIGAAAPDRIPEFIGLFNRSGYFSSYSFYADAKEMAERGALNRRYVLTHLPKADTIATWPTGAVQLRFDDINLQFILNANDRVVNIDVMDFRAHQKHKLALSKYKVFGNYNQIGFSADVTNHGSKTIKYIRFGVQVKNRVDDVLKNTTAEAVGPIQPGGTASVEFPQVMYSTVASSIAIKQITIVYMDGTTATIPEPGVKRIVIVDWEALH